MAMTVAVGSGRGGRGGRTRTASVFAWIARFTEGGLSLTSCEPGSGLTSSLVAAAPDSGAEVGHGEALTGVVARIEQ